LLDGLTPVFVAEGFRVQRAQAGFRRDIGGVEARFSLGMSSRPPSLGRLGVLIEPGLSVWISRWSAEAAQRAEGAGPWVGPRHETPVAWSLLDWLVDGKRPHWILPDEPTEAETRRLAGALVTEVRQTAMPYFEQRRSPPSVLELLTSGQLDLLDGSRFTVAAGALLEGRPDLAANVIARLGTARREAMSRALGLTSK